MILNKPLVSIKPPSWYEAPLSNNPPSPTLLGPEIK